MDSRGSVETFPFTVRRVRDWRAVREIAFDQGAFKDRVGVIRQGIAARSGLSQLAKWGVQLIYPYRVIRTRKKLLAEGADR